MDIEKVGKAIAYLRKRAGYTQKDLADRLGISDKAVSKWERGIGLPDITYFGKLAILLDTDTDSLLSGDVIHHDENWGGLLVLEQNPYGIGASTLIYDKPLIYYLLSYYLLLGIKHICIACSHNDISWLQNEFDDGGKLGIRLHYCPNCSEDICLLVEQEMSCHNMMAIWGQRFIYGVDQTRFFQRAMLEKDHLTILSLPKKMSGATSSLFFDESRKIVDSSDESTLLTQYDYYEIPVLFGPKPILMRICSDRAKNDAGLTNNLLQDVPLYTEVLDRGFVEIPVNTPDDVVNVSQFVKILQNACGMIVYCIEEIAWRRGMISLKELEQFGLAKAGTAYGQYILSLCSSKKAEMQNMDSYNE